MDGYAEHARCAMLRELIVEHRRRLTREAVGLPRRPRTHAVGLTQEDLAELTGFGVGVVQRLEKGQGRPGSRVLDTVATVLRMDASARRTLYELGLGHPPPASLYMTAPDPGLLLWLDRWIGPAVAVDASFDVLGANSQAIAWLAGLGPTRNLARWLLRDGGARRVFPKWEPLARWVVQQLRPVVARLPGDRRLRALAEELRSDQAVDNLWRHPGAAPEPPLSTLMCHPPDEDGTAQIAVWLLALEYPGHDDGRRLIAFAGQDERWRWPCIGGGAVSHERA